MIPLEICVQAGYFWWSPELSLSPPYHWGTSSLFGRAREARTRSPGWGWAPCSTLPNLRGIFRVDAVAIGRARRPHSQPQLGVGPLQHSAKSPRCLSGGCGRDWPRKAPALAAPVAMLGLVVCQSFRPSGKRYPHRGVPAWSRARNQLPSRQWAGCGFPLSEYGRRANSAVSRITVRLFCKQENFVLLIA